MKLYRVKRNDLTLLDSHKGKGKAKDSIRGLIVSRDIILMRVLLCSSFVGTVMEA